MAATEFMKSDLKETTIVIRPNIQTGTTHLISEQGSILLVPSPTCDPADPLNWSTCRKWLVVVTLVVWSGTGIAVQTYASNITPSIEENFPNANASQINLILTICAPLVAAGELIFVPLTITYGRRFALILSIVFLLVSTIWNACAESYGSLLGSRVLQGLATGPTDAIIFTLIQDFTFQHERGNMLGFAINAQYALTYVYAVVIPYMGTGAYVWSCTMFSAVVALVLVALIFIMPETRYYRPADDVQSSPITLAEHVSIRKTLKNTGEYPPLDLKRRLRIWPTKCDGPDQDFWLIFRRMGKLCLNPLIWWNALLNAMMTGGFLAYSTYFANMLADSPWSWPTNNIGLINLAVLPPSLINWVLLGWGNDKLAIFMAKQNGGVSVPEHRLILLAIPVCIGFASLIGFGFLAEHYFITSPGGSQPTWWCLVILQATVSMGFSGVLEITYTYLASTTEPTDSLAAMTVVSVVRDLTSFGMSYGVVGFATKCGYLVTYSVYAALVGFFGLMGIPVYFYAYKFRTTKVLTGTFE